MVYSGYIGGLETTVYIEVSSDHIYAEMMYMNYRTDY